MRTRQTSYKGYGMTKEEVEALTKLCRNLDKRTERLLLESARESCPEYADRLFSSLKEDLSYERLCGRDYIYLSKGDFYGYRRMTLFLLKEKLMTSDETIVEKWKKEGCLRRYATLEEASKELQLSEGRAKELAKKANAAVVFGKIFRINMNALYNYIEKECAVEKRM